MLEHATRRLPDLVKSLVKSSKSASTTGGGVNGGDPLSSKARTEFDQLVITACEAMLEMGDADSIDGFAAWAKSALRSLLASLLPSSCPDGQSMRCTRAHVTCDASIYSSNSPIFAARLVLGGNCMNIPSAGICVTRFMQSTSRNRLRGVVTWSRPHQVRGSDEGGVKVDPSCRPPGEGKS